jgi:itaconyl-CoA hydratase
MSWFEDFEVGDAFRHARGKTVTEVEGLLLTHLAMNTAQAHFNADAMREQGGPIVFGGVVAAVVIGLATQDTAENAARELGLDRVRFKAPVHHGDTLYTVTEVLEKQGSGEVRFRHTGINQHGVEVCEIERRVLLRRRP